MKHMKRAVRLQRVRTLHEAQQGVGQHTSTTVPLYPGLQNLSNPQHLQQQITELIFPTFTASQAQTGWISTGANHCGFMERSLSALAWLDGSCRPRLCSSNPTNLSCYDALVFLFWYDIHRLVLCVLWSGIYWIWSLSFRSITIEGKKRKNKSDGCCLMLPMWYTLPLQRQAALCTQIWDTSLVVLHFSPLPLNHTFHTWLHICCAPP